jgi:hypothetical protein
MREYYWGKHMAIHEVAPKVGFSPANRPTEELWESPPPRPYKAHDPVDSSNPSACVRPGRDTPRWGISPPPL